MNTKNNKFKAKKIINAAVSVGTVTSVAVSNNSVAIAADSDKEIINFSFTNDNGNVHDVTDKFFVSLEVFSDPEKKNPVAISSIKAMTNDLVSFRFNQDVSGINTFYYNLKVDSKINGKSFSFGEKFDRSQLNPYRSFPIDLLGDTSKNEKGRYIYFVDKKTGVPIDPKHVTLFFDEEHIFEPELSEQDENSINLSTLYTGSKLRYEINVSNYKIIEEELTVESEDKTIEVLLEPKEDSKPIDYKLNRIYGSEDVKISEILDGINSSSRTVKKIVSDDENIISVENNETLKINNAGSTNLKLTLNADDYYNENTINIPVEISKKKIGVPLDISAFDWDKTNKTYDGTDEISLKGTLKDEFNDVVDGDLTPSINATLKLSDKNVGMRSSSFKDYTLNYDKNNYTMSFDDSKAPSINITPYVAEMAIKNQKVNYGSDEWNSFKNGIIPSNLSFDDLYSYEIRDKNISNEFKNSNPDSKINLNIDKRSYLVGNHDDVLSASIVNSDFGNFSINLSDSKGNLLVSRANSSDINVSNAIEINNSLSSGIYQEENNIYLKDGSKLAFNVIDKSLYDSSKVKIDGVSEYKNTIEVPNGTTDGNKSAFAYLYKGTDENTRTNEELISKYNFVVDNTAPTIEFIDGIGKYALSSKNKVDFSNNDDVLKFTKINSNNGYTLNIRANDELSGIDNIEYSILKVSSNDDAKKAVMNAANNPDITWNQVKDNSINVPGNNQGYYIVLVKASDKLGNTSIHASNGTVVDTTSPIINVDGLNKDIYYSDLNFSISVRDPRSGGVSTGIDKLSVKVYSNGKLIPDNVGNTNSFTLSAKDIYGDNLSGNKFDNFNDFAIADELKTINGKIDINSNDISLDISAYDTAGNMVSNKTINGIKIDKTSPAITGSFDNNNAKNEKYFNTSRVLSIDINQRNYNENNLKFEILSNGKSGVYSIDDIKNGLVDGVSLFEDKKDNQADLDPSNYTDDRVVSYKLKFGDDSANINYNYKVNAYYLHNEKKQALSFDKNLIANEEFIIDNIKPTIRLVSSDKNGSINISNKKDTPTYSSTPITNKISITDDNFDPKDVLVNLKSYDANGVEIPGYPKSGLDKIKNIDNWVKNGNTYTFTFDPFDVDANYELNVSYKDLAGNAADESPVSYFTIDKTAPNAAFNLSVFGKEFSYSELIDEIEQMNGIKKFVFDLFVNSSVNLIDKSFDNISGIKSVKYYIDDSPSNASQSFDMNIPLDTFDWKDINDFELIDTDRNFVIYERVEDNAGNIRYISSKSGIILDTKKPANPKISIDTGKTINKGEVPVTIDVSDQDESGKYSGIKAISYEIYDKVNNKTTQKDTIVVPESRKLNYKETIKVKNIPENDSNNLVVKVNILDYANNNTYLESESFAIDNTSPTVSSKMNKLWVRDEKYYNRTKKVNVSFEDKNFDSSLARLSLNINGQNHKFTMKDIENGVASKYGISLADKNDSQSNRPFESLSDRRSVSYTLNFGDGDNADFDYSNIVFDMEDAAGNLSNKSTIDDFVVIKVTPKINVDFKSGSIDLGSLEDTNGLAPYYTNKTVSSEITILDRHFNPNNVNIKVTQTDINGKPLGSYILDNKELSERWETSDFSNKLKLDDFIDDGRYTLDISYETRSGNSSQEFNTRYIVVDKTAPNAQFGVTTNGKDTELSEEVTTEDIKNKSKNLKFGNFSNNSIIVNDISYDDISGMKSIKYNVSELSNLGIKDVNVPIDFSNMEFKDYIDPITISSDSSFVVFERVEDMAGNVSYAISGTVNIIDTSKPLAPIISSKNTNHLSKDSIDVNINAKDSDNDGRYSGISLIEYELYNEDTKKVTQRDSFSIEPSRNVDINKQIKIDADEKNNSNNLTLRVRTYDYAGNMSESSKTYGIDITDPIVRGGFDGSGSRNGKYYNKTQTASVEIVEKNYDPSKSILSVDINGINHNFSIDDIEKGLAKQFGITIANKFDSQDGVDVKELSANRIISYDINFGDLDGINIDYENISFKSLDVVGNSSNIYEFEDISVDKSVPATDISFVRNKKNIGTLEDTNKSNPYYSNDDITANIKIEDRRFVPQNVEILITQHDFDGNIVESYVLDYKSLLNNWVSDGKSNILTLDNFSNDARYSINVKYKNLAGTDAPLIDTKYFVVDKTAPEGKFVVNVDGKDLDYSSVISQTEKNSNSGNFKFDKFTKNSVYLKDYSKDVTAGIKSIKYYIDNTPVDAKEDFDMVMNLDAMEFSDISDPIEIKPDKNFIIYERIEDMAGNVTYLSSNGGIAIDTKAPGVPVINVNGGDKDIYNGDISIQIDSRENHSSLDSGVYSGLKNVHYEVYNAETREITQKGDFEIPKSRISRKLNNIILDSKLNNSNNIELRVTVSDYAGNRNEITKNYAIDNTKPVTSTKFDTTGVKNGKYYNQTKFVDVEFTERNFDSSRSYLELDVNGTHYKFSLSDILAGKASKLGIGIENHLDTQKNRDTKLLTDSRKNSYKVSFGNTKDADFDYQNISFNTTDKVGNTSNVSNVVDMTIDKIAPIVDVHYFENGIDVTNKISTNSRYPYYTNNTIVPIVQIDERNFRASDINPLLSQSKYNGQKLNAYNRLFDLNSNNWKKSGNRYSLEMSPFVNDAIYGFDLSYEDLAGNKSNVYPRRFFAVDKTPPVGFIDVKSSDNNATYNNLSSTASFEHVSRNSIGLNLDGNDDTTGLKSIDYYIYDPGSEARNTFNVLGLNQLRNVNWNKYTTPLSVNPDSQAVVYARLIDMANNVTYVNTNGAVLSDRTEPFEPSINITSTTNSSQGVFNSNVGYNIHVEDILNGGTYAGLKTVTVDVLSDGVVTQTQTYDVGSKQARVKNFDTSLIVDANKNNSNNVVVRVTATDNALNTKVQQTELSIDITPPRIEVLYDLNEPSNGKYYNNRRTATIRVYERNFDPSLVNLDIKGGNVQVGTWQIGNLNKISDDNVNTLTVVFDEDADYSFTFDLTDGAGNSSKYDKIDEFTVDQTLPTIDVSYDKKLVNDKYINETRVATITINEHNFDANDVDIDINSTLDGKAVETPRISGWSSSGDIHTATITFDEDADYGFTVDYKDLANNQAETYKEDVFVVDKTPVKINFERILDKSTNRDEVKPLVRFEDYNFNKETTTLTLIGLKHKPKTVKYDYRAIKNGGIFELFDLPHTEDIDDIYTLSAKSVDFAGNETIEEITFAVNRYGSVFYLDDDSKSYVNKYYNNLENDIILYEVNPDEVSDVSVVISRDGASKKLDYNDFKLIDLSEKDGWHKYKYIIPKKHFKKEGSYKVVVQSSDKAGNKQDNNLKKVPVEFIVDKTKPNAVITGVENNATYNNTSREVGFSLSDNIGVNSAKVYINNKKVMDLDYNDLKKNKGEFSYTLKESDEWQEIKVVVSDGAGNVFETDPVKVIVSSSAFVRFINSTWLKYSSIGLIALLLLLLLFLFKRDEDKDEEDNMEE